MRPFSRPSLPSILSLVLTLFAATVAQLHAQAREVVVVYDDSGSMGNPQNPDGAWRYANYALQGLTGLLAPRDALTVVRMSEPSQPVTVDLARRAEEITTVHQGYRASGQTPYAAVRQAMALLEERARRERAAGTAPAEKWLIVITDGEFQLETTSVQALRAEIRGFVEATGARVIFLLIGDIQPALARFWEEEAQAQRYEARTRGEIIGQMQRIAADITARSPQPLPFQLREREIRFTSEFPLRRLTALQQRARPEELVGVSAARGVAGALHAEPPLRPQMPVGSSNPIVGHIIHLREARAEGVIPAGEVVIGFERQLDPDGVQLLPEVAARLAVWMTDVQGRPLAGQGAVHELCAGDTVRVRATLLSPQGDTLIRQAQRLEQFDVRLQYGSDTRPLALAAGGSYFEGIVAVEEGPHPASVSAAYPGYFNFRSQIYTLRGAHCPVRTLGLAAPPWSARVTELRPAPPLELIPTADGARVPAEELAQWNIERVDDGRLPVRIERTAEGWQLRPRPRWGTACFTPTGRIPIELELRSGSPREPPLRTTVEVEILDAPFWEKCGTLILLALAVVAFLVWLIGVLRKRRFCPGSEIVYERRTGSSAVRRDSEGTGRTQTYPLPHRFVSRWLIPYVPERTSVDGVTFEAGARCGHVLIPAKAQSEEMYVAGERIEDPGRRPARLQQSEALEIRRGRQQREVYTYHLHRG